MKVHSPRKDQRPGGEGRRQGRLPEEGQRRHERGERPADDQAARNPSQSVIYSVRKEGKGTGKCDF